MPVTYSRVDLVTPLGLMSALRDLFPDFGDEELEQEVQAGEASLHTVMREFLTSFRPAEREEKQLNRLASLVSQCVSMTDDLENAVGTCFLEHLRQVDKGRAFWKYLSPEVKEYVRAH